MCWWKRLKQVCFYEHGKFHVPWLMRNIQKGLYNEILLMKHKYHRIHVCNIHALETRDWRTQASKQELAGAWFESKRTLGVYIMIQSILKAIGPGISLEGMMLKLKLQYFGHLMWRADAATREKPRGSPVITRWGPCSLQRLKRSPTFRVEVRNVTWHP